VTRPPRPGPARPARLPDLRDVPLIVVLAGIGALAMAVPAAHGFAVGNAREGWLFLGHGGVFLTLTALLVAATVRAAPGNRARARLLSLLAAFTLLPLMLAAPFHAAVQTTSYVNAWFEMVSAFTTTGATLFEPGRLSSTLHLWRALVGWMGGFLVWVAAIAILAPMNLGGFEVLSTATAGAPERFDRPGRAGERRDRVVRHAVALAPVYGGLTLVLWLGLVILGEAPLVAACHAMAILATSGISPVGGLEGAQAGLGGEALMVVFLALAVTRATFSGAPGTTLPGRLRRDPEMRIALVLVAILPTALFLRHWFGAYEVNMVGDAGAALRALWGAAFSTLSFLTTTGFVSSEWDTAQAWSGLGTPGLVLLGLALLGGGVATTAGGVKLLRVYALYRHGAREMGLLVHPSSVGGAGATKRRLREQGAYIAWIFFMLFALALAALTSALAATGVPFDAAMVLTVSALSNAGPAAHVVLETPLGYAALDDAAKGVLAAAMVLGRLETLAIIALLNPEFWRR